MSSVFGTFANRLCEVIFERSLSERHWGFLLGVRGQGIGGREKGTEALGKRQKGKESLETRH